MSRAIEKLKRYVDEPEMNSFEEDGYSHLNAVKDILDYIQYLENKVDIAYDYINDDRLLLVNHLGEGKEYKLTEIPKDTLLKVLFREGK